MRIIGGEFRGRRLLTPRGRETRPTPDRVREGLFAVIEDRLPGARVVELFAGTGSLGLEALSRGATHAVFLEIARAPLACLRRNVESLGVADRATIHPRSAFRFPRLARDDPGFDLVFCDPPFRMMEDPATRPRIRELLAALPLAPQARILLEHRAGRLGDFVPPGLVLDTLRRWGSTGIAFFRTG